MGEYIKREDAEKALLERCEITGYGGLTRNDVKVEMKRIPAADVVSLEELQNCRKELQSCRDELCLKCGSYRLAHLGACDHCRYKDI